MAGNLPVINRLENILLVNPTIIVESKNAASSSSEVYIPEPIAHTVLA